MDAIHFPYGFCMTSIWTAIQSDSSGKPCVKAINVEQQLTKSVMIGYVFRYTCKKCELFYTMN